MSLLEEKMRIKLVKFNVVEVLWTLLVLLVWCSFGKSDCRRLTSELKERFLAHGSSRRPSAKMEYAADLRKLIEQEECCQHSGLCYNDLGMIIVNGLGLAGSMEEGLQAFQRAAAIDSTYFHRYLFMLNTMGRFDEAAKESGCDGNQLCSEAALVEWAVAGYKSRKTAAENIYERLNDLNWEYLYKVSDIQHVIRGLHYLALTGKRLKLYREAFDTALKYKVMGAEFRSKNLNFASPDMSRNLFMRDNLGLRTMMESPWFQKHVFPSPRKKKNMKQTIIPVFIVGLPKSGSSLLEELLQRHPRIVAAGEVHFMEDQFTLNRTCDDEMCHYDDSVLRDEAKLALAKERYLKMLYDAASTRGALGGKELGSNGDGSVLFVVDKMLLNWQRLPLLARMFPEAVIIRMVRNVHDVAISNLFVPFTDPYLSCTTDTIEHFLELGSFYHETLASYYSLYPELRSAVIDVHYEMLVRHPRKILWRILSKRMNIYMKNGLEKLLDVENTNPNRLLTTSSEMQVREPIYKSSIGNAKHYRSWIDEKIYNALTKLDQQLAIL